MDGGLMALIVVEVKVIIADEFGNRVTSVKTSQRSTEGNPKFFNENVGILASRCVRSAQSMIETEYGKVPE